MANTKKLHLPGTIALCTRMGRDVPNEQVPDPPPHKALATVESHRKKYPFALVRRSPTGQYNCHGLTFASRRTSVGLDYPDEAWQLFREDDGYRQIEESEVEVGDLVVFHDGRSVSHTGVVVEIERGQRERGILPSIRILSKWGHSAEYCHSARYGPYADDRITYWTDRP